MREKSKKWNFYKHSLYIRIEGLQINRLITQGIKAGILLRGFQLISETEMRGWISKEDLRLLKKIAKSSYQITVLKGRGPEYQQKLLMKNPMLIVGVLLSTSLVLLQYFFVATIEISGYQSIPEQELATCLQESGIREGSFRPKIQWDEAKASVLNRFPQITWVRLVYDGRKVILEVAEGASENYSEELEERLEWNKEAYAHIVAEKSGYIERITPLWGNAMVEAGDYVKKGQILISGMIPIQPTTFEENGPTEYYVRAQGEVWAKVPYHMVFRQERYLSSENNQEYESGENDDKLIVNFEEKTQAQILEKANQQIRIWSKENLPESAEIINKSLNFSRKENIIEASVTLEVRQQIGIEEEILIGEKNSDHGDD